MRYISEYDYSYTILAVALQLYVPLTYCTVLCTYTYILYSNVYSSTEILALLLAYGADPDISSNSGSTAAHEAAYRGELEFLQLLAASGANMRAVCVEGLTPLEYARKAGQDATVQWLEETVCKPIPTVYLHTVIA